MASIATDGTNGTKRVQFFNANGERKTVRLGKVSQRDAEGIARHVEALATAKASGQAIERTTALWLADLGGKLRDRLAAVGLVEDRARATLGDFLNDFSARQTVKSATSTFYGHTARNLLDHFGASRSVRSIEASDADGWRAWLTDDEKLSPATVGRRVVAARTIWRKAVRWKLADENPFEGVRGGSQINDARKVFVPREVIEQAIAATPDLEWRAIIALARYAGIRTPSETLGLRWGDISWDAGTMLVRSPKTEGYAGKESRLIPLFEELRPHLLALFEQAEPGEVHVIARYRSTAANLRTQFERILARAGVKPWPRLFHALRASRESELMADFDLATACAWIGNSPAVAARHYAVSTDLSGDFKRAAGLSELTATTTGESGAKSGAQAAQNQAHTMRAAGCTVGHDFSEKADFAGENADMRVCANTGETGEKRSSGPYRTRTCDLIHVKDAR